MEIHEFHVWQLAGSKIIASLHLKFPSRCDYTTISESIKTFFHDEGIHSTTIQPEFLEVSPSIWYSFLPTPGELMGYSCIISR